jgi:hypothetical protein
MKIDTPQKAYEVASQWGSYMNAGDPGSCFYGFHINDGRPQDELHRKRCLEYTQSLYIAADDSEREELAALRLWFAGCEVRSNG